MTVGNYFELLVGGCWQLAKIVASYTHLFLSVHTFLEQQIKIITILFEGIAYTSQNICYSMVNVIISALVLQFTVKTGVCMKSRGILKLPS